MPYSKIESLTIAHSYLQIQKTKMGKLKDKITEANHLTFHCVYFTYNICQNVHYGSR